MLADSVEKGFESLNLGSISAVRSADRHHYFSTTGNDARTLPVFGLQIHFSDFFNEIGA